MLTKMPMVLALLAAICSSRPAIAIEKCPINDTDIGNAGSYAKAVAAAVRNALNCERSYGMLEACQLGSTADNAIADRVQSKCEPRSRRQAPLRTIRANRLRLGSRAYGLEVHLARWNPNGLLRSLIVNGYSGLALQ
jgi:hypothetical protein